MSEDILICEDSQEGVFTGIYEAYRMKLDHSSARIQIGEEENLRLFANYITIPCDPAKAAKVGKKLLKHMGQEGYEQICMALSSDAADKGDSVYKTVVLALSCRDGRAVLNQLADPHVLSTFKLARGARNEAHHLLGFVRFRELESGVLYSDIQPKNRVIPFIMPHFANRFPEENFVIRDVARNLYGIHQAGQEWFLATMEDTDTAMAKSLKISSGEEQISQLFTWFCRRISIESRENRALQRQNLPLRFQEYMVEFSKNE